MALQLGNLLGAVANVTTITNDETTLQDFLNNIDDFGVQVKNNFEVNFSGLQGITFRVMDIKLPSIKANTTQAFYDGKSIPIMINYDFEHDFSMTLLNDAQGYMYTVISELIMSNAIANMVNGGYTMTIKALTGDDKYEGSLITCTGVRITGIDGLDFGQSANEVQTFGITGVMQKYTTTPGKLDTAASILETVNSLLK